MPDLYVETKLRPNVCLLSFEKVKLVIAGL